jgi:hypothetical protein
MTKLTDIILELKNKNYNEIQNQFKKYIIEFFNNWFTNLNKNDLDVLIEITFFLIIRIQKLFFIKDSDLIFQFTKNNNQDIKAITLLYLPYLNDDLTNLYNNLYDLNEIICSKNINEQIFEMDKTDALKEYFKYSTIGLGLVDKNKKINLEIDGEKMIYKIIFNKLISLLNTLSIINGKLYINWINITPLTLENYKDSNIYKETHNPKNGDELTHEKLYRTVNNYLNSRYDVYSYNGLYIGEFYNVYRNIYYEDIKKVKWIIFPYTINNKKVYLIQYLQNIINVNLILENKNLDELNYENKINFEKKFRHTDSTINNYDIWKNFIIFMVNNYTSKLIIFEKGNEQFKSLKRIFTLNSLDEEQRDDDFNKISLNKIDQISNNDIYIFLQYIDIKYVWEFINESLVNFQSTVYSQYLIKDNKIEETFFEFTYENNKMNLKNLYNIAKSLSHDNSWNLQYEKYDSIDNNNKSLFWDRISNPSSRWLNIRKNLDIESEKPLTQLEYNQKLNEILICWNNHKYDLIWNYLVTNGILNEFKVDYKLTDKNNSKNLQKDMKEKIKQNPHWRDAYYYLTNRKFSELQKIQIKKSDYELEDKDYFDMFTKELKWYSFYAMDWICQINFYNHYLNHRVLFVTGATGQGKSTQVPKLLMYSVKMLDYKVNGKVICTQPRINVTVGNSEWISTELGLPIKTPNLKLGKIKTDNFHLQYKYSEDNHIKNICPHLTLKLATDGSLFEELINNALIKEQLYDKKKETFEYTSKNKYDIIIIDESHEHNTNMDLLTTIIRNSVYFNNDVKFVIMSATLEEDEPIYRRYFRFINDNLLYPIIQPILNQLTNEYILIERVYLDRRFHISPPGQTTQYTIKEDYLSAVVIDKTKPDKFNADLTLKKSYEIIKQICNESQKGDILLFANGRKDIMNSVKYLNEVLPEGNITLPYLSELNERYKDIILNIEKTIGFIKNKRSKIHETWSSGNYIEENVPNGIYKRAIIIATNVAEASLTLPSLKYVVETGYTKTNIYDSKLDNFKFEIEKISEASRKQRKGRVGRTGEGSVHYIYEKGSRESILPKFKISQENIEGTFLKLIKKDKVIENNEPSIYSYIDPDSNKYEFINPNIYNTYIKNYNKMKRLINNKKDKNELTKNNILKILVNQYTISNIDDYINYWTGDYFYFDEESIKLFIKIFTIRYTTGFNIHNIADLNGEFYLIHPFESSIKRNIFNEIIKYNDKKVKKLPEKIFNEMLFRLNSKMLLIDIEYKGIYHKNKKIEFDNYYVCEIYNIITIIRQNLKFINRENDKEAFVIMAAMGYDCLFEVIGILTLLTVISYSVKNLFTKQKLKNYDNQDRELEYLYDIIDSFKKKFYNLNIFKVSSLDYLYKKYKSLFEKTCKDFEVTYKKYKENKNDIPKNFNKELFDELLINYENGKLYDKKCFESILNIDSIITKEIYDDFELYKLQIKQWCEQININSELFLIFIKQYAKNIINILTITKNNDSKYSEPSPIEVMKKFSPSFIKTLDNSSKYEKIIKCFIFGYPFQYGFKIDNSIFHTTNNNLKVINLDTKINNFPYILYLQFDKAQENNLINNNLPLSNSILEIKITNKIKIEWLCSILPIYFNANNFKPLYLLNDNDDKLVIKQLNGYLWENICNKISNNRSTNSVLFDNVDKNEYPILYKYVKIIKQNS